MQAQETKLNIHRSGYKMQWDKNSNSLNMQKQENRLTSTRTTFPINSLIRLIVTCYFLKLFILLLSFNKNLPTLL